MEIEIRNTSLPNGNIYGYGAENDNVRRPPSASKRFNVRKRKRQIFFLPTTGPPGTIFRIGRHSRSTVGDQPPIPSSRNTFNLAGQFQPEQSDTQ